MTILVASDSFKDGCSSVAACKAIGKGIKKANKSIHIIQCPITDGGESTIEVLKFHLGGRLQKATVADPLFRSIEAEYLILNNSIAIVEMAKASGLQLLKTKERNPMNTTTFGTGELIKKALDNGIRSLFITVGGSATNDFGVGMASALGIQFYDVGGNPVTPIGGNLAKIASIDTIYIDSRIQESNITILTDVQNPLFGKDGAAFVFGRQKGASPGEINLLDLGLRNMAKLVQTKLGKDITKVVGGGAAGGMGAGGMAFLGASLRSGIETIMDMIDMETMMAKADIIITGEGHLDSQTMGGKVIQGIVQKAQKLDKSVHAFCGKCDLSKDQIQRMGLDKVWVINEDDTLALTDMLKNTKDNLISTGYNFAKALL